MIRIRRRGRVLALATSLSIVVFSVSTLAAMGAGEISGSVFHDVVGDGLNDGGVGSISNPGLAGATVHVYHDDGSTPGSPDATDSELATSPVTTGSDGTFEVDSLADGDYWIAVDSTSFGLAGTWAEQTWGPIGSVPATASWASTGPRYGGRDALASDDASSGLTGAEHIAFVTISGAEVEGLDFGFSFNVVTRTGAGDGEDHHADPARTVQGSLRQFLTNANAIPGGNSMRFVPITSANAADVGAVHRIVVTTPLPAITGDGTIVDGTAYSTSGAASDLNPGVLSSPAASVGVDALPTPSTPRPDLELVGSGPGVGLHVDSATGAVIRGVTLRGFTTAAIALTDADAALIEHNAIGGFADPGAGSRNGIGIELTNGTGGTITSNSVAHNGSVGINVPDGGSGWSITNNDIDGNGLDNDWADQVRLVGGADFSISGNHIRNGRQIGIEIRVGVGALAVDNNTVEGNGTGGTEIAGIRNINQAAQSMTVSNNVVVDNAGPGLLISRDGAGATPPSLMTITGNRFGANGGLAIDLTTSSAGRVTGDGPNPLSAGGCGTGSEANAGVDRPTITGAYAPGPYVRITGTGCPGATIDFYYATADASDTYSGISYGEPTTWIGSATVAGDGTIDAFLSAGPAVGDTVTALSTDTSGNTSEPAANVVVAPANIPVVSLQGSDPLAVEAGGPYADPGATATDVEDGDLTGAIVVSDPVDEDALGSYSVAYDVTDSDGFPAVTVTRSVVVADTQPPTIILNGPAAQTVEGAIPYADPGATATDAFEGDLTGSIVTTGSVDPWVLGPQIIGYGVADSSGNSANSARTVTVVDTTAPTLTVHGSLNPVVTQNSVYVDAGADAIDTVEGDLTAAITVTGSVNTAVRGTYPLAFDVADSSGNAAPTVLRNVLVADPNPPIITVTGLSPITSEAFDAYVDPGATAQDTEDGDLTSQIVVTNPVDIQVPGTYTVGYRVEDDSGNQATATRTVRIVDTTGPVIELAGDTSMSLPAGHEFIDPGASATDRVDGPAPVTVIGTVDTSVPNTATLIYTATDAAGNTTSAQRTVEVLTNHAPDVAGETYRLDQGDTISIAAPGLLTNDVDPEGEHLTVSLVGPPEAGVVSLTPDGAFTYRHSGDRDPTDSFTYEVRDPYGNVGSAEVSLVIHLDNRAPVVGTDFVDTSEDLPVTFDPTENDSDPDGDAISVVSVGGADDGAITFDGNQLTFTPAFNWHGTLSLTYTVSDGFDTTSGTVQVNVGAVNDPPVPVGDHYMMESWDTLSLRVLDNDFDPEHDSITLVGVSTARHGTAQHAGSTIHYSPSVGYWGVDEFTYTIEDEHGATAAATVTISVSRPEWVEAAVVNGGGALLAAGPDGIQSGPSRIDPAPPAEAIVLFVGAFLQQLLAQSVHLALLLLSLLWFVLFGYSQWRRAASKGKRYAVVLLDREDRLEVFSEPGGSECMQRLDAAERRLLSAGRPRKVHGQTWIPIETANGTGWVDGNFVTEDAARSTFERDVTRNGIVAKLRSALSEGRQPSVSRRGALDPESLARTADPAELLSGVEAHLVAEAISDPAAEILIDELHAPDSLRPAQLRNFHWITVISGDQTWHLFFEYHRDTPALVTIRREGAPLPRSD